MLRKIIHIDEELCTGCGLCVDACHEGAIGMVDGKARLLRDDYCDGLGDCLPACPTNAITFIEREAAPYDEEAVEKHLLARAVAQSASADTSAAQSAASVGAPQPPVHRGCPGAAARALITNEVPTQAHTSKASERVGAEGAEGAEARPSQLAQWPCQIKLVPLQAPYYQGRGLLIAADCAAYAHAGFHERFMKGNTTIIGCPKLDEGDYTEKLSAIIAANDITSVTVVRMQVPCCGGIERAAAQAVAASGKPLPFEVVTLAVNGEVL